MNATAYTPLESLLLFQSLAVFGTEPNVFAKISNILKNNVLIQECDKYDAGRLSPDALRELYLQLLREEIHNELEVDISGDASPSRKRKVQAPPLPTITDAKRYNDKLPQLVDRLYARYRDHMVRAIREDERRYELLSREIVEINRGEWDERLRQEQNRGQRTSSEDFRRPPSIPRTSAQPERPVSRDTEKAKVAATPSPAPSPRTETRPEGLSINDVLNSTEPPPILAHVPEKDSVSRIMNGNHPLPPINHHRTASSERPHGPSPLQQNQRLPPPPDWKWENSYQAPPPPQHQAQPPPPHGYPPPYPPHQQQQQQQQPPQQYGQYPPRGSFSGAPPQSHSIPSSPHAPQHNPIVLPPINGRGPGSPANHLDQLAEVADQQYRATQSQSPMVQHQTSGAPMPPHYATSAPQQPQYMPTAGQLMPYQPQYGHPPPPPPFRAPSHPSQTPPPPQWKQQPPNGYQQQQFPPPQPPPQNNYYPAPPQQPAPIAQPQPQSHSRQGSFAARPELPQLQQNQYNSPYNPAKLAAVKLAQPNVNSTPMAKPPLKDHLKERAPSTPAYRAQTLKTGKFTLWKVQATPGTPRPPGTVGKGGYLPESPAYEPLSPVLQPALPPMTSEAKQQTPQTAMKDKPARGRGRPPRARASSGSTEPGTPSRASNGNGAASTIKKEALATQRLRDLAPANPENGPPTPSTKRSISVTESSDEFAVPEPVATTGRKRKLPSPEAEREREPSKPATHVSWTRNFPKISASALERIGAHRTASTFALPIKDRDAPGYREAIRRPMDLKSIKVAITAGNRAGIAMLKEMEEKGEEVDKNAMVVELPMTKELVPPRGIVNSRQLERELMLMFANAVMFNPDSERGINLSRRTRSGRREGGYAVDEDGVVKDARLMAQDVQIIINELRETERKRESESIRSSMAREVEPKDKGKSKSEEKEVEDNETEVEEGPAKKRKRPTKD